MFSVVIPLYNKKLHIGRAITSVLNQTHQDFEIIIVDDGSTDNSADIVTSYKDSRIKLIRQKNAGVSSARNRGVEQARGNLVAFLDADDEWMPKHLEIIKRLAHDNPGAGIYATCYEMIQNGAKIGPSLKAIPPPPWQGIIPSYFKSAALGAPPVCSSTACIPTNLLRDVGCFLLGRRMGEDLEMWGRIAISYPVAFSWEIGATYFHDSNNRACLVYKSGDENPFIETAMDALANSKVSDCIEADLKRYLVRLKLNDAKRAIVAGEFTTASEIIKPLRASQIGIHKLILSSPLSFASRFVWLSLNLFKFWINRMKKAFHNVNN